MVVTTEVAKSAQALFLADALHGLSQSPKTLPCKWFYDEAGSVIFEEITETPEYYPTRVETKLLLDVVEALQTTLPNLSILIEPGSGSSIKTRMLLGSQPNINTYVPMDISADFLAFIAAQLDADYPHIKTLPLVGDFTNITTPAIDHLTGQRLVFFPGSTIGNFSPSAAKTLLNSFHHLAGEKGWLLIGVDGTQDEAQLLSAYNDASGTTAAFNKNLLVRANKELGANFDLNQFKHLVRFNKTANKIEMHLESQCTQTVQIAGKSFHFKKGETIFTESCYKYAYDLFESLANACHWQIEKHWVDEHLSDFQIFLLKPA